MALSQNAARALEQVKMGLYMLYGADYFTEEEWIKIDGLIHKGRYVLTNGPQQKNGFEEALITFDDNNEKSDFSEQITTMTSFDTIKEEPVLVSEMQIPSPTISERADSTDCPSETPNTTSAEVSSDDEPSVPMSSTEIDSANNASQATEPANIPKREPVQIPTNGGLALGYTQAQLDEVKAFNSGLTKAGQKSKPKYNSNMYDEELYPSPERSQNKASPSEPPAYPSPTSTEHETRSQIQTWASDVHAQETSMPTPTPHIVSPAPTKGWTSSPPPEAKPLIDSFKKTHGRNPKSINDLVQPNNPEFRPLTTRPVTARPFSRVSHKSAKSTGKSATSVLTAAATATATQGPGNPQLKVSLGTILIAQRSCAKQSKIQIEVKTGDQIRVGKHVSGITHTGENLRTGQKGQFSEDIFRKAPSANTADTLIQQQRAMAARKASIGVIGDGRLGREISISTTISNGLDRVEGINAAEWDDVASHVKRTTMVVRPKTTAPAVQAQTSKPVGGLGSSRFAMLADEDESINSGETQDFQGMSKEEVGELFDQKFAQILAAQAQGQSSIPTHPSRSATTGPRAKPPINGPLKKVNPKTATCWWWATPNKECRFTADECRDLHAFLPSAPGDPPNMRMGKPTWGALADSLPATTSSLSQAAITSEQDDSENSAVGPNGQANVGIYKSKTCWYWANDPNGCNNSASDCKYLHEKCSAGVANKPNSWKKINWNRFATSTSADSGTEKESAGHALTVDGDGDGDGETDAGGPGDEGELVLEVVEDGEIVNSNANVWAPFVNGANTWAAQSSLSGWAADSDKYKPPHIKALEEKALVEAVGW